MNGYPSVCSPPFVPLTTTQGLHPSELLQQLRGRTLVIWGCGHMGRALARVFRKFGATEATLSFCDRRPSLIGARIDGTPVKSIDAALDEARDKRSMIVVAVGGGLPEILRQAEQSGLRQGEDLIAFRRLARPEASIQIVHSDHSDQLMQLAAYHEAVRKLVSEIPHLFQVELVGAPDPLCHPDLPEMIELVRDHTACVVTSELDGIDDETLSRAIRSRPSLFVVRVDGNRPNPELLRKRLSLVAGLRDNGGCDTEFRVNYLLRRTDSSGIPGSVERACREVGIPLVASHGYLNSYDRILDHCQGLPLAGETHAEFQQLSWNLDRTLEFAQLDRGEPCLCQRIFPVIHHDLSVAVCHLYERPRVAEDFLADSYPSLIEKRHRMEHCRRCQEHSLHRLDVDVLKSRHQRFRLPGETNIA